MLKIMRLLPVVALASLTLMSGCTKEQLMKDASGKAAPATVAANQRMAQSLNFSDRQDFEEAKRGLIARPEGQIRSEDGSVLIDFDHFKFITGDAPSTVNNSLWRHAMLNAEYGLFKVTDGVYQVRGFDIANMTLIEGKTGWIVVDALTCREVASYALAFARKHLGEKPVSAVIITHSHIDHFGGILGIISPQEVALRKVPVIVPEGFMEESISENVMVGIAMARRSTYQFGKDLERSATGVVDGGMGKEATYGHVGILKPTLQISQTRREMEVDGVRFVFYNNPYTEAPAEMTFLIPEKKAYCGAEILSHSIHNLLTLRGAKVRDSLRWGNDLDEALSHAADAEVYFGQHNWPVWGRDRVQEFITKHRDVYLYTHDQTVRLINAGYTPREIAEKIKLPRSLASYFGARGYYGDLRHNVKAVYQFYLGFYDGNPANLNPLPPQESGKRYVELIGGADKAVAAAQSAFDRGDYRWAAELLNHVVFAAPEHKEARELLARTHEQMAYMSESAIWRNSYLKAAYELRYGAPRKGYDRSKSIDIMENTPAEYFIKAMAAGLNGPAAEDKNWKINLIFSDTGESFVLWIENAVLHHRAAKPVPDANATMTLTKSLFLRTLVGKSGIKDTLFSDELKISGSKTDLLRFFALFDKSYDAFPIVTPK